MNCNGVHSYLYVSKTEIYKFETHVDISWYDFGFRRVPKDFTKDEQSEISLNDTIYDFSVDRISVVKENILNIHEYLMLSNRRSKCL